MFDQHGLYPVTDPAVVYLVGAVILAFVVPFITYALARARRRRHIERRLDPERHKTLRERCGLDRVDK